MLMHMQNVIRQYLIKFPKTILEAGSTLTGIIADWSDQQISGLEMELGKPTASNLLKGCQVCILISNIPILVNILM